jgi:hypothetical protein
VQTERARWTDYDTRCNDDSCVNDNSAANNDEYDCCLHDNDDPPDDHDIQHVHNDDEYDHIDHDSSADYHWSCSDDLATDNIGTWR